MGTNHKCGNVIARQHVHFVSEPAAAAPAPARPILLNPHRPAAAPEPRISVVKDGDAVRSIEIVCGCGEVIRIDCEY